MSIGERVKTTLIRGFGILGLDAQLEWKRPYASHVRVDQNLLHRFFEANARQARYDEGMRRAGIESRDSFLLRCRSYDLQSNLEWVLGRCVEGDCAECGCWTGHSTYIIADLLAGGGFDGEFFVFDSFEQGLPERGPEDRDLRRTRTAKDARRERRFFRSSLDSVRDVLRDVSFVRLCRGWIPEGFPAFADRRFAFVHIDVDLFRPTLESLDFFLPRMVAGGAVVVDDYGSSGFPGATRAVDEALCRHRVQLFHERATGGCLIVT